MDELEGNLFVAASHREGLEIFEEGEVRGEDRGGLEAQREAGEGGDLGEGGQGLERDFLIDFEGREGRKRLQEMTLLGGDGRESCRGDGSQGAVRELEGVSAGGKVLEEWGGRGGVSKVGRIRFHNICLIRFGYCCFYI